eukprot:TRINITY_DN372_c0_g1_i4.p1 TRINITY_DN372_c0_g1~~TRINITY_DN372_c0_g1_i4.p1  ORF type:complete len:1204 (+),score=322.86 TRINITY_DN372_c0_g1_i4:63-3614(+)
MDPKGKVSFSNGDRVWLEDERLGWTVGAVFSVNGDNATVLLEDSTELNLPLTSLRSCRKESPQDVDNLFDLVELHEGSVLECFRRRYARNVIYTAAGNILFSVNPFQNLAEDYYGDEAKGRYRSGEAKEPHLYLTANAVYEAMTSSKSNQAILFSGRSGSGKTEGSKKFVEYLTGTLSREPSDVRSLLRAADVVLEMFGNCKTLQNSNSSRFCRLTSVDFDTKGVAIGAKIDQILFERSRCLNFKNLDDNFHIFAVLCRGANETEIREHDLDGVYFNDAHPKDREISAQKLTELKAAFATLHFSQNQQTETFRILSAILHLGNIDTITDSSQLRQNTSVQACAKLLGISSDFLAQELAPSRAATSGSGLRIRDTFLKFLYRSLFDWILSRINTALDYNRSQSKKNKYTVAVLDIPGFESSEENSLEQFLNNYCEERFQQFYNKCLFLNEHEEITSEGIKKKSPDFQDNSQCVQLLDAKPYGFLPMLDEELLVPQGNDRSLLQKLQTRHASNPFFVLPKLKQVDRFTIRHHHADVTYLIDGFLEKNRESQVPGPLEKKLQESELHLLKTIISLVNSTNQSPNTTPKIQQNQPPASPKSPRNQLNAVATPKKESYGSQSKNQIGNLINSLSGMNSWFIRCILPNDSQEYELFDGHLVLNQIRSLEIVQSIQQKKNSFSEKYTFAQFVERFKTLLGVTGLNSNDSYRMAIQQLLEKIGGESGEEATFQVGKSKIYLKSQMTQKLEDLKRPRVEPASSPTSDQPVVQLDDQQPKEPEHHKEIDHHHEKHGGHHKEIPEEKEILLNVSSKDYSDLELSVEVAEPSQDELYGNISHQETEEKSKADERQALLESTRREEENSRIEQERFQREQERFQRELEEEERRQAEEDERLRIERELIEEENQRRMSAHYETVEDADYHTLSHELERTHSVEERPQNESVAMDEEEARRQVQAIEEVFRRQEEERIRAAEQVERIRRELEEKARAEEEERLRQEEERRRLLEEEERRRKEEEEKSQRRNSEGWRSVRPGEAPRPTSTGSFSSSGTVPAVIQPESAPTPAYVDPPSRGASWDNYAVSPAEDPVNEQDWFYGDIQRKEAEKLLISCNASVFLVRNSSVQGSFALSLFNYNRRTMLHLLIQPMLGMPSKFQLQDSDDKTPYDSLVDLIKNSPVVSDFEMVGKVKPRFGR